MLPLQVRVDLEVMTMKGYSAFPKTPASYYLVSYAGHSLGGGFTLLKRWSRCILQTQPIVLCARLSKALWISTLSRWNVFFFLMLHFNFLSFFLSFFLIKYNFFVSLFMFVYFLCVSFFFLFFKAHFFLSFFLSFFLVNENLQTFYSTNGHINNSLMEDSSFSTE